MKKLAFIVILIIFADALFAQEKDAYVDSIMIYQRAYVDSHEVVGTADKKYFRFFAPDKSYRVIATITRLSDTTGFIMKTSGTKEPKYFKYGILQFFLDNKPFQLRVYQSAQLRSTATYKNYLFVPYTDLTSGDESYGGGKYIEFFTTDIKDGKVTIDFNKAYNPYCAYTTGYNCPIPPRENNLPIAIRAGEKMFGKEH